MTDQKKLVKGRDLGFVLCDLLGLDPKCVINLTVTCRIDDVARVTADMLVRTPDGKLIRDSDGVKEITKRFVVTEEEASPVTAERIAERTSQAVKNAMLRNG